MATTERGRVLVLEGSAAERGRQHGEALRDEVRASLSRFLDDAAVRMGVPGERYVERFLAETAFGDAIRVHTPELLDELHGIEQRVEQVTVPLSYADELYALRTHIQMVGNRLRATSAQPQPSLP